MISDTHPEVAKRQLAMFQLMNREQRVLMAIDMSDDIRNVALDGIRMRNPALSDEQQKSELIRVMYGHDWR